MKEKKEPSEGLKQSEKPEKMCLPMHYQFEKRNSVKSKKSELRFKSELSHPCYYNEQ